MELIRECYDISREDAEDLMLDINTMINRGSTPGEIIKFIEKYFEFPDLDFIKFLTDKIVKVYNNTRQWA